MMRMIVFALLTLAPIAEAGGSVRCQTYHEATLNRWQTICSDGTRGVSTYNRTLQRWDTTLTPPAGKACTGQMNPKTRQWEGRCR